MIDRTITPEDFTKIKHDVNGNPRYVLHFLKLNSDAELDAQPWIDVPTKYNLALSRAHKANGRKFHNKQFGGGIVFQEYSLPHLCKTLNELRSEVIVDQDDMEEELLSKLPHGSGINCKWEFEWLSNGKVKASNAFHCMNEHGYYDGYAPFTLIIDPAKHEDFKLVFNGRTGQNKNRQYMLREYIEDTLYEALRYQEV